MIPKEGRITPACQVLNFGQGDNAACTFKLNCVCVCVVYLVEFSTPHLWWQQPLRFTVAIYRFPEISLSIHTSCRGPAPLSLGGW